MLLNWHPFRDRKTACEGSILGIICTVNFLSAEQYWRNVLIKKFKYYVQLWIIYWVWSVIF